MQVEEALEIDLEAFETDYHDAKIYYKRALQYLEEGYKSSLVFNLASVAVERYLVAMCGLYGEDPRNHNYNVLMESVEKHVAIPKEVSKKIRSLDWIFGICSIDEYRHPDPDKNDMDKVLQICTDIENLFDAERIALVRKTYGITNIKN